MESRQPLGPWEGEAPSGKATLGAEMGSPRETHLSLPACPHHRPHSPLDGGSKPGTVTVLVRIIIININDYAENCWPNFENLTVF